jgi:hypothetical protein
MRRFFRAVPLALFASALACALSSVASAAAVVPASSGIKTQFYYVEWCATHYNEVINPSGVCRTGYFVRNIQADRGAGEVGVRQDGLGFTNPGSQTATVNTSIAGGSSGRTGNSINNNPSGIPFFLSNNAQGFTLKGEGIYTIHLYSQDYAGNTSHSWVRYKVDKTAPNFEILGLSENSDYAHVSGDTYNVSTNVGRYDMWTQPSSGVAYDVPRLNAPAGECGNYCSSYSPAQPERRAIHNRSAQYGLYFRNPGDNAAFTVHTKSSDDYEGFLTASSYLGNLVSGTRKVMLLASDGTPIADNLGTGNVSLSTANLIANGLNSQKTYILRIYDNTYGRDGSQNSGNYSEAAFRVIRDNTAPNMGGNGLAGTDPAVAQRDMIKFADDESVYDPTIYSAGQYFSRFLGADTLVNLRYRVRDTGVTGDGTATGAGCTTYEYCNAGLSASEFYVEQSANPTATSKLFTLSSRFESTGDVNYDFSKVDNDLTGRNRYRYYSTNWRSPMGTSSVCDLVGNCFTPSLTLRVVSASADAGQSSFTLAAHSLSPEGKMLANGLNAYRISYTLKDKFGNLVTPVRSAENAGNPLVKNVANVLAFSNGLYENQLTNTPTGNKKAFVADQENDNIATQGGGFSEDLNGAGSSVSMTEALSTSASDPLPNATYTLTLASRVPTVGMYPFLTDAAKLTLDSIRVTAANSADASIQYPKTDASRLGLFDFTFPFTGTGELVVANTGAISISGTSKSFSVNEADYGKIGIPDSTIAFNAVPSRRMSFEYAPRALYSVKNMGMLTDGIFVGHDERVYKIDSTITSTQYNVYQRPLVAYGTNKHEDGVFDFRFRAGGITSDMNPGTRLTDFRPSDSVLGRTPTYHNLDVLNTSGDGKHVEIQLLSIPSFTYDTSKTIRLGFASALTYDVSGDTIQLPAYARDLSAGDSSSLTAFAQARNYFSNDYTINGGFIPADPLIPTPPSSCTGTGCTNPESVVGDIAVTGLINATNTNAITNDTGGTKGAVIVDENLSRSELMADIKRNVEIQSAGLADASAPSGKRWCDGRSTPFVIDQSFLDPSSLDECTVNVQGELVSFIEGNATISCGGSNCTVNDPRTIIVKSGALYIDANVTTLGTASGKLLLATLANGSLAPLNIDDSQTYDYTDAAKQGWTFVDPEVTNIDAFVISQGPVVSYSDAMTDQNYYGRYNTEDSDLRNQLHIFGSLLALNNIGGSRQSPVQCPYIVLNCGDENSQIFDLIYLRRFTQVYKYKITGNSADTGVVPFYPNSWTTAKRSGGLTGDTKTCSMTSGLRCIEDPDYQKTPLFIERDNRWNSSPSVLFRK